MRFFLPIIALLVVCSCTSTRMGIKRGLAMAPLEEMTPQDFSAGTVAEIEFCKMQSVDGNRTELCLPCVPPSATTNGYMARMHANRLWQHSGRAPYAPGDSLSDCTRLAYLFALEADSGIQVRVDYALFQLYSAYDSTRATGLRTLDMTVDTLLRAGDTAAAVAIVDTVGRHMIDRTTKLLARPSNIRVNERERGAHDLGKGASKMVRLSDIPSASSRLGVSEGVWASRLFAYAQSLTRDVEQRARFARLSITPWVVMRDWDAVDSIASTLLAKNRRDSIGVMAHALSQYELNRRDPKSYPRAMALFDTALQSIPRADSAQIDSFDDVFSSRDDAWRYEFLPGVRQQLETRGWSVVDPLWLTPVNELRLEKRARATEANFRYAHLSKPRQSGSETDPGIMLLKGGSPVDSWYYQHGLTYRRFMRYGWAQFTQSILLSTNYAEEPWRWFYGEHLVPEAVARATIDESMPCRNTRTRMLVDCARSLPANWNNVLYYGLLDTIDVTLTRFRAGADSFDVHMSARVPMRAFRHRDMSGVRVRDSITVGAFIANSFGEPLFRSITAQRMPSPFEVATHSQWSTVLAGGNVMHRVEASDLAFGRGAIGAARLTSAEHASLAVRGFGMSDILVAANAKPVAGRNISSWRDFVITPNGGVAEPGTHVALMWEVYDLARGADGRAHWRVSIRREDGDVRDVTDTRSVVAGVIGSTRKVLAAEPDATTMRYERNETASARIVENVRFELGSAGAGHHVLMVTLEDLNSGKSVTRAVSIRVLPGKSQAREQMERARGAFGSPFANPQSDGWTAIRQREQRIQMEELRWFMTRRAW